MMRLFPVAATLLICVYAQAQVPDQREQLRLQIWAELDSYPGRFEDDETSNASDETDKNTKSHKKDTLFDQLYSDAIERAKLVSPFLAGGFLHGWTFDYTPSDKARGVEDYWEFAQKRQFDPTVNRLSYREPLVKDGRLLCWVYCDRTEQQKAEYKLWTSILRPKVHGHGEGLVEDGFEGIREACSKAARDAVRSYWRTMEKNKPKEITGQLLLTGSPRIYIKNGRYVADLEFLLDTERIVRYQTH